jgi:hypothetical protein
LSTLMTPMVFAVSEHVTISWAIPAVGCHISSGNVPSRRTFRGPVVHLVMPGDSSRLFTLFATAVSLMDSQSQCMIPCGQYRTGTSCEVSQKKVRSAPSSPNVLSVIFHFSWARLKCEKSPSSASGNSHCILRIYLLH